MRKILISKNFFVLIFADVVLLILSYLLAYIVRFEAQVGSIELINFKNTILPVILCKLFLFYFFDLYRGMWRYTGIVDLINIVKAIALSLLIIVGTILMVSRFQGFSRSVFIIDAVFSLLFIGGVRLVIRIFLSSSSFQHSNNYSSKSKSNTKLIIIGAGDAAEKVVREINDNPRLGYQIVGFVDDDKRKHGKQIHGITVIGSINELNKIVNEKVVDAILIAVPSVGGKEMRRIVELCHSTKIPFKTLPGIGELIDGEVSIKTVRDISYKDLLRRQSVQLENQKISEYLNSKCVLITGAGGSIGSELCRQICKYNPQLVVLFDACERNLYSIQMEIKHSISYVKVRAVLGRVQDVKLIEEVISKFQPDVIFHAAAYKHVPLIERNPWEAIFNNILGTNILVKSAIAHKIDRFVFVSTDKAVRPTNVMGASKRVAELIIQSQKNNHTKFMGVRFGNVIGSSGSVVPLFFKQIENGGPITITHPDIERYFMTVEEAAQLILQAFTMGEGGEIFILEMGSPIKIVDVARDLIKLSGKKYESEIELKFIGLRPGEKMFEELITEGEGIVKTDHKKILVLKNGELGSKSTILLETKINELVELASDHDAMKIKCKLKELVPEYTMSDDECVV